MQREVVPSLLIKFFDKDFEKIETYTTGRLEFKKATKFKILEMSYNVSLITGLYNSKLPIESYLDEEDRLQTIKANSVGFTLSTPILYLTSNVGIQSYRTNKGELRGAKIVMRINNSFISDCPIIVNNADFRTTISSNDLSMLEFTLVDANMHEIRILSPIYITVHVDAIENKPIISYIMYEEQIQNEMQRIQEAKLMESQKQQNEWFMFYKSISDEAKENSGLFATIHKIRNRNPMVPGVYVDLPAFTGGDITIHLKNRIPFSAFLTLFNLRFFPNWSGKLSIEKYPSYKNLVITPVVPEAHFITNDNLSPLCVNDGVCDFNENQFRIPQY